MNFNEHYGLSGRHAFLSPSQYHWLNYTPDVLEERYFNDQAKKRGVELHEFASQAIKLGRKMPKNRDTLNMFVNDAIGYSMASEQILYYSENCFGTADAISFRKNQLRIQDLKTGVTKASMLQLRIYAALFCLEYEFDPKDIKITLVLYQLDEKIEENPDPEEIQDIMDKIVDFDSRINEFTKKLWIS